MQKYIDLFEERAGIIEFDGGFSRDKAEVLAKHEVFKLYKEDGGFLNRINFNGEFNQFTENNF